MSKLIRYLAPGQTYFVTSVTHNRQRILVDHQSSFWDAINNVKIDFFFELIAWVLIPDHFHIIINPKESDLSSTMKRIKLTFAYQFRNNRNMYRGKIWQRRFWDHIIRDENDLSNHLDYIHYNPVTHGLVCKPSEWEQSSFHSFLKDGHYEPDWGTSNEPDFEGDFGE